jgi:hypothetical protein
MARDWWFIAGDAYTFRYPETCACCAKKTADRWDQIPYCQACRAHVPRFGPWLVAIAAIAVGMATAVAMRRYAAFSPWFIELGATLLAAIALPVLALVLGRRKRVGAPHVDREQAVEITRSGLLVRSESWAEKVAKLNSKAATHTMEPSLALVERALPFIGALLPLVFAMWWHDQWHTSMWIDNGTQQHVVVHGDGHELASLDAGERIEVTIPRNAIHITSTANDDVTIDERITAGTWVLNVGGAHCYEYQSFAYGESESTLFLGTEPQRYHERLFNVPATWFFQPPPKTITIRKDSSSLPVRGLPHYRGALQIVPCH